MFESDWSSSALCVCVWMRIIVVFDWNWPFEIKIHKTNKEHALQQTHTTATNGDSFRCFLAPIISLPLLRIKSSVHASSLCTATQNLWAWRRQLWCVDWVDLDELCEWCTYWWWLSVSMSVLVSVHDCVHYLVTVLLTILIYVISLNLLIWI